MALNTFAILYNHHHYLHPKLFHHPHLYTLNITLTSFLPPVPRNLLYTLCSMKLPILGTSYTESYSICPWVWLISLNIRFPKFIHFVYIKIPSLYGWITFQCVYISILSIHVMMNTWIAAILWLSWIMLPWALTDIFSSPCFQFFLIYT